MYIGMLKENFFTKNLKVYQVTEGKPIGSSSVTRIFQQPKRSLRMSGDGSCRHAKRSTLSVDDVKLLVRRNDSLKERLVDAFQQAAGSAPATKGRGSKKKADAEDADPNFS